MAHFNLSTAEKQEFVEEICTELSVYLGMLYFLIEVFKGDDEFGEELSRSFLHWHLCYWKLITL